MTASQINNDEQEFRKEMTASQKYKSMGGKSLKELSEHSDTSCATLINWFKHNPKKFYMMCLGVVTYLINQENK